MADRYAARLSLIHMLPVVARARGIDPALLLAEAGIDAAGVSAGVSADDWRGQVVARGRICAILAGLARRAGDPLIGLDLAQAADPAAPGPAEEARIMCDGIAGFIVLALRRITGRPDLPVHVTLPHRGRARVGQYEDRLAAGVSLGGSGAMVLRFPARWLDVPNRLCGGPSAAGSGVDAGTGPWTGAVPGGGRSGPGGGRDGGWGASGRAVAAFRAGGDGGEAVARACGAVAGTCTAQPAAAAGRAADRLCRRGRRLEAGRGATCADDRRGRHAGACPQAWPWGRRAFHPRLSPLGGDDAGGLARDGKGADGGGRSGSATRPPAR